MTGPVVAYPDGKPNGLASMLGGLIQANLASHPERARFLSTPATFSIVAVDAGVAVSIELAPGRVTIRNGAVGRADLLVEGESAVLMGLSAVPLRFGLPDPATVEGRAVTGKLLRREIRIRGLLRHPGKLARLNRLLSVG